MNARLKPASERADDAAPALRPVEFDHAFRARLRELLVWRRDVRRFRRDPCPNGALEP